MKRIFALLLALLLMLSMAACQLELPFLGEKETKTDPPDEVLEDSLDALVEGEGDTMMLAADGSAVAMTPPTGIGAVISGQLEYDIKSVEVDGERATAELEITAPDAVAMVQVALEGMTEFDETAFLEKMEQLANSQPATKTFDVTVEMVLAENGWCIVPNNEFSNAITGGLAAEYTAVRQAIAEALEKGGGQE